MLPDKGCDKDGYGLSGDQCMFKLLSTPTVQFLASPDGMIFKIRKELRIDDNNHSEDEVQDTRHQVHRLKNEALRNTEMWHMRYGCSAPSTLHKTQ